MHNRLVSFWGEWLAKKQVGQSQPPKLNLQSKKLERMLKTTRNSLATEKFVLTRLDNQKDFCCTNLFDCGDEDLNEFFQKDAYNHRLELLTQTFYLQDKATRNYLLLPVAFISFLNDNIRIPENHKTGKLKDFWKHMKDSVPEPKLHYLSYPAVKIARLGVKKDFQGMNIGTYLLNMVKELFLTDNRTGCRFITVDAYNRAEVIKFYEKNGFMFLWEKDKAKESRIMYFDLKFFNLK